MASRSERRSTPRPDDPELRGRRVEPRAQIRLKAMTDAIAGRGSAVLIDLSCAGAQLEGSALPQAGKDVLITLDSIEVFGTVLWREGDRCGVLFEEPISRAELAELRRCAGATPRSRFTDEEIEAAADWVNGLAR